MTVSGSNTPDRSPVLAQNGENVTTFYGLNPNEWISVNSDVIEPAEA